MYLSTMWTVWTGSQVYTEATHIKCTLHLQLIVCQLHVNKAITNTSLETVAPWLGAHGKQPLAEIITKRHPVIGGGGQN